MTIGTRCAAAVLAATGLALAAPALAASPSFTYVEGSFQHTSVSSAAGPISADSGWRVDAGVGVWDNLFVSGSARHYSVTTPGSSRSGNLYNADAGYSVPFADTFAAYGKLGWSRETQGLGNDAGYHAEVGLRADLISILDLRAYYARFGLNGGMTEYGAAAELSFAPMFGILVGYDRLQGSAAGGGGDLDSYRIGLRWSL